MTTVVTNAIRIAGATNPAPDYTLISLWGDDIPPDITAAGTDEQWVAECYNDWPAGYSEGSSIGQDVTITSATNNIVLTVPDADKYQAINGNAFYVLNTKDPFVLIKSNYSEVSHLNVESSGPGVFELSGTVIDANIHHNVIKDTRTSLGVCVYDPTASSTFTLHNNLIYKTVAPADFSIGVRARGGACKMYNNVISGFHRNYRADSGNGSAAYNCISVNDNDYGFEDTIGGDNNASDDTSAPGASSVHSIIPADEFEDYAGYDFHLSAASILKDVGLNLLTSGDLTESPQHDIDGDEWPLSGGVAWNIGIDWIATGGIPDPDPIDTGLALGPTEYEAGSMYLGDTEIETMFLGGINITQQYVTDENGAYLIDENNNYLTYGD